MGIESLIDVGKKYWNANNRAYIASDAIGAVASYAALFGVTYTLKDSGISNELKVAATVGAKSAVSLTATVASYLLLNRNHKEKNDALRLIGAMIPGMAVSDLGKVATHYVALETGINQKYSEEAVVGVSYFLAGALGRVVRYGLNMTKLKVIRPTDSLE